MNILVQNLADQILKNDPAITALDVNRLPLWTVTAHEMEALVRALEHNHHVTQLDFWLPQDTDESEGDYDFSSVIDNEMSRSSASVKTLPGAQSYLETVLTHNDTLKSLQVGIDSNSDALYFLASGLKQNKSIERLEIAGSMGRGSGESGSLLAIITCQALADYLASTTHLKHLVISSTQAKSPQGLVLLAEGLAVNKSLESVELVHVGLPEDGCADMKEQRNWEKAWAMLIQSLGQIPTLRTLLVISCDLPLDTSDGEEAMQALGGSQSLECLRWIECDLSTSTLASMAHGMDGNTTLRALDLRGNGLGSAQCEPLAHLLQHKGNSLQKLVLEENLIGNEGLARLVHGLTKVVKVNLRGNLITASGCESLANALSQKTTGTQRLDLSENAIGDDGAAALGRVLASCKLTHLDVECCLLTDNGVAGLMQGLCDSKVPLQLLSLSQNHIGESGTMHILRMLSCNTHLQSLDVSACRMSDHEVSVLAEGFNREANSTLKHLSLAFNSFGNDGAKSLGKMLPKTCLERLEVQFNNFNDDGLACLVQGLAKSYFLKDLFILNADAYTNTSPELVSQMSHWLSLNRAGRRILLEDNLSPVLWPHVLDRANKVGGTGALFHLLREYPNLASGLL